MNDTNKIILTDDSGQEVEMEIVLTFDYEELGKQFVLITDPKDVEGDVFAYSYDDFGNLEPVTDPKEFEICAEVLSAFEKEDN